MGTTPEVSGRAVLAVPARIDQANVTEVMQQMREAGRRCVQAGQRACVIDLSTLEQFDSTVLSMLLELSRQLGRPVSVINPPPKLQALARLYGVSELLGLAAPEPSVASPVGQA
ncbi:MAG: STAS domain-containing protein [Lautropia sp.]|nr:STAS domain-containing protein [Lautropia sp.]